MTSLPSISTPSTADLAREDWLPLSVAAPLLGHSEGHARNKAQQWEAAGNARKVDGSWQVRVAAFPRLIRLAAERTDDGRSRVIERLRAAPADKRIEAGRKVDAVARFRRWRSGRGVRVREHLAAYLPVLAREAGLARISQSSLYAWDRACGDIERDRDAAVAALLDTRGRPTREQAAAPAIVGDAAWEFFKGCYLTTQKWSIAKCCRATRAQTDLPEHRGDPAWRWVDRGGERRIAELVERRIDAGTLCLAREGLSAWRARFETPIEQAADAWQAGECWESDHTTMDLFARVLRTTADGPRWERTRPIVTAWLDRRTRRIMGWHIAPEGSSGTIRAALLSALQDPAISPPRIAWLDNGKDFASAAIGGLTKRERRIGGKGDDDHAKGLLGALGIEAHFATPYNHNGKARIERFFGTMHMDFEREFASWCGSKPGDRDRDAIADALRDVMALPTIDEVRTRLAAWITAYNARSEHGIQDLDDIGEDGSGRRLSPDEFYHRHAIRRRLVDRDALVLLEHVFDRPRAVHKYGVHVSIGGRVHRFGAGARGMHPRLAGYVGTDKRVVVSYNPADTRSVSVWTTDYALVCIADENDAVGGVGDGGREITAAARKAAANMQREQRRRAKQTVDIAALSLDQRTLAAKIARDAAVAETAEVIRRSGVTPGGDTQAPLALVRTPLDGKAAEHERAELRLAAGAETRAPGAHRDRDFDAIELALVGSLDEDDEDADPIEDDGIDVDAALLSSDELDESQEIWNALAEDLA